MAYKLRNTEAAKSAVLNNEVNGKHIRYAENLTQADIQTLIENGYGEHFEVVAVAPAVVAIVENQQDAPQKSKGK